MKLSKPLWQQSGTKTGMKPDSFQNNIYVKVYPNTVNSNVWKFYRIHNTGVLQHLFYNTEPQTLNITMHLLVHFLISRLYFWKYVQKKA